MAWNNTILTHSMFPVSESTSYECFPVLSRFCVTKTTCITKGNIILPWILKPSVGLVPLWAKVVVFVSFHCSRKLQFWLYWSLYWSSSNVHWNFACSTSTVPTGGCTSITKWAQVLLRDYFTVLWLLFTCFNTMILRTTFLLLTCDFPCSWGSEWISKQSQLLLHVVTLCQLS